MFQDGHCYTFALPVRIYTPTRRIEATSADIAHYETRIAPFLPRIVSIDRREVKPLLGVIELSAERVGSELVILERSEEEVPIRTSDRSSENNGGILTAQDFVTPLSQHASLRPF